MRRSGGNHRGRRVHLSSGGGGGGGTGGEIAHSCAGNQPARDGSIARSGGGKKCAVSAGLDFGSLWQEPEAGVYRGRRFIDRPAGPRAVELCLLQVDG